MSKHPFRACGMAINLLQNILPFEDETFCLAAPVNFLSSNTPFHRYSNDLNLNSLHAMLPTRAGKRFATLCNIQKDTRRYVTRKSNNMAMIYHYLFFRKKKEGRKKE